MLDCSEIANPHSQPQAIEKILHKYELEIRTHIKMEQEFKKLAEEADKKFETLKSEYATVSLKYNEMMIKLSDFAYTNDNLLEENSTLKKCLADNQIEFKDLNKRSGKAKTHSNTKEKNGKNNSRNTSTEFLQKHISKLKKVGVIRPPRATRRFAFPTRNTAKTR
jgi:hypothetical protein